VHHSNKVFHLSQAQAQLLVAANEDHCSKTYFDVDGDDDDDPFLSHGLHAWFCNYRYEKILFINLKIYFVI
jgi:hypothetical protein